MRLKSLTLSNYKNLKNFTINFDGTSMIDIFVGKNGSGKSNLLEAIIEIFRHLYASKYRKGVSSYAYISHFSYKVSYEINSKLTEIEWKDKKFIVNGKILSAIGEKTLLPDNLLLYYSGHNQKVRDLVDEYALSFSKKIKDVDVDASRYLISMDKNYKEFILALMLLQPETNKGRQFVIQKLGVKHIGLEMRLVLERPHFAPKNFIIDPFDDATHYWGAEGITKTFLKELEECISKSFTHMELFDSATGRYSLPLDTEKLKTMCAQKTMGEILRLFDNLKLLGMIDSIALEVVLANSAKIQLSDFSDGQFQTVYVYALTEIFKDRDCLVLLDEPDAFLHPEWQASFLEQIKQIAPQEGNKNHILMTTHSAVTLKNIDEQFIRVLEMDNSGKISAVSKPKKEVVRLLSNGAIDYSADEQKLLIDNVLRTSSKPVLFVEGVTDVTILTTAYKKLYSTDELPFLIQDAFDRGLLQGLLSRSETLTKYNNKIFFGLFDFDDAYHENFVKLAGEYECQDITLGLRKKLKNKNVYAFMLPIPDTDLRKQVCSDSTFEPIKRKAHFCIEHIFWDSQKNNFKKVDQDGEEAFKFRGDKVKFAQEIIPTLETSCFEVFRPMFEFIKEKCKDTSVTQKEDA